MNTKFYVEEKKEEDKNISSWIFDLSLFSPSFWVLPKLIFTPPSLPFMIVERNEMLFLHKQLAHLLSIPESHQIFDSSSLTEEKLVIDDSMQASAQNTLDELLFAVSSLVSSRYTSQKNLINKVFERKNFFDTNFFYCEENILGEIPWKIQLAQFYFGSIKLHVSIKAKRGVFFDGSVMHLALLQSDSDDVAPEYERGNPILDYLQVKFLEDLNLFINQQNLGKEISLYTGVDHPFKFNVIASGSYEVSDIWPRLSPFGVVQSFMCALKGVCKVKHLLSSFNNHACSSLSITLVPNFYALKAFYQVKNCFKNDKFVLLISEIGEIQLVIILKSQSPSSEHLFLALSCILSGNSTIEQISLTKRNLFTYCSLNETSSLTLEDLKVISSDIVPPPYGPYCFVTKNQGLQYAVQGKECHFNVRLVNGLGQRVKSFSDFSIIKVIASIFDTSVKDYVEIDCSIKLSFNGGELNVRWIVPTSVSSAHIEIIINNQNIYNSPFHVNLLPQKDSICYGVKDQSIPNGELFSFVVDNQSYFNSLKKSQNNSVSMSKGGVNMNRRGSAGAKWVTLFETNGIKVSVSVSENKNSVSSVSRLPLQDVNVSNHGDHAVLISCRSSKCDGDNSAGNAVILKATCLETSRQLAVTFFDEAFIDEKAVVKFAPGLPSPAHFSIHGLHNSFQVDKEVIFKIIVSDAFGNTRHVDDSYTFDIYLLNNLGFKVPLKAVYVNSTTFSVNWIPKVAKQNLFVVIDNIPVIQSANKPFNVTAGAMDCSKSLIYRTWDKWDTDIIIENEPIDLDVMALVVSTNRELIFQGVDVYSNSVFNQNLEVDFINTENSQNGIVITDSVANVGLSRVKVCLQSPLAPGNFIITVNGVDLPSLLHVVPGKEDFKLFEVDKDSFLPPRVGLLHKFAIIAKDSFGNAHISGGLVFRVKVKLGNREIPIADLTDNENGFYDCQWEPPVAPTVGNIIVEDFSIFEFNLLPGVISPSHCIIQCNNGQAIVGEEHKFTLIARDSFGNISPPDAGAESISVTLQEFNSEEDLSVEDQNGESKEASVVLGDIREAVVEYVEGGSYLVTWITPSLVKEYTVHLDGVCLGLGFVTIPVLPGPLSSLHSNFVVDSPAVAGTTFTFTLNGFDAFGNKHLDGGGECKIFIGLNGNTDDVIVTDNYDGTYSIEWCVNLNPGQHSVFLNEEPLDSFIEVIPGPLHIQNFIIDGNEGNQYLYAKVSKPHSFFLQAADRFKNQLTKGGEVFAVKLKLIGDESDILIYANVNDCLNGIYEVTWNPPVMSGNYAIYINNTQLELEIILEADDLCIEKSSVEIAKTFGQPQAGELHKLILTTRDQYGNVHKHHEQSESLKITFNSVEYPKQIIVGDVLDLKNGCFEVSWTPVGHLSHFNIFINGNKFETGDLLHITTGPLSPNNCLVQVSNDPVRLERHSIMLTAKDAFDNIHSKGGAKMNAYFQAIPREIGKDASKSKISAEIEDIGDGRYIFSWIPNTLESFRLIINNATIDDCILKVSESMKKIENFKKLDKFYFSWEAYQIERHKWEMEQLKNSTLDDLDIQSKIGEGAGGQLWAVKLKAIAKFDKKLHNHRMALKKMWDYGVANIKLQDEFDRDFVIPSLYPQRFILNVCAHFNAPTIEKSDVEKDVGTGTTKYVLMDLYPGNLQHYVQHLDKPLDDRKALLILLQLVTAINHLSNKGIAHRDLKLNNIVINRGEEIRLIDFGCATDKMITSDKGGNPANMALEIIESPDGVEVDHSKVDIWAMGCLAYELVGFPHPFVSKDGSVILGHDEHLKPPSMGDKYPRLQEFVDYVLILKPDARPSSSEVVNFIGNLIWPIPNNESAKLDSLHGIVENCIQILAEDGRLALIDNPLAREYLYFDSIEEELRIQYVINKLKEFLV